MAANWREGFELVEDVRQVNNIGNRRRPVFRKRANPFEIFDDNEFMRRYRISKDTVRYIVNMLREDLEAQSDNSNNVSVETKVLVTLRFFAKGCYQIENADLHGLCQPSVSNIVQKVSVALARRCRNYINMPVDEETEQVKTDFFNIAQFPKCIGCVDCTHVRIKNPDGHQPLLYCNRKGWYSLNVQVICDAKCRIRDIVARWRGSTHDARIWVESSVKENLENGYLRGIILGDGGYPCTTYLLTPLINPRTPSEQAYNVSHIRTRNTVERLFGQWKNCFRALQNGMQIKLETAKAAIVAMAVLYNIKLERDIVVGVQVFDELLQNVENEEPHEEVEGDQPPFLNDNGNLFRRNFIRRHFDR